MYSIDNKIFGFPLLYVDSRKGNPYCQIQLYPKFYSPSQFLVYYCTTDVGGKPIFYWGIWEYCNLQLHAHTEHKIICPYCEVEVTFY